jgi:hypothetical protein
MELTVPRADAHAPTVFRLADNRWSPRSLVVDQRGGLRQSSPGASSPASLPEAGPSELEVVASIGADESPVSASLPLDESVPDDPDDALPDELLADDPPDEPLLEPLLEEPLPLLDAPLLELLLEEPLLDALLPEPLLDALLPEPLLEELPLLDPLLDAELPLLDPLLDAELPLLDPLLDVEPPLLDPLEEPPLLLPLDPESVEASGMPASGRQHDCV